jgi:hypothetical protein
MSRLKLDRAPEPVLLEGDARVHALQSARSEPEKPEDYVEAISRLWSRAQTAFLDIGRLLIRAKDLLPHGEYIASVEERLPFSGRTAYQLREAARWALEMDRRQTITLDRLPGSYSTIYLLSTLDPSTLERAEAEGIVRPELRRAELIAWRKGRGDRPADRAALLVRKNRIMRELAKLDGELRLIEAKLAGSKYQLSETSC